MPWLYLFTAVVMSVIAIYHLFSDRFRRLNRQTAVFRTSDPRKLHTESLVYKMSVYSCYIVLILSVLLVIEVFNNFLTATLLFIAVFITGLYILLTLDRVFEIQGEGVVFAGYHARWSKIRSMKWGKTKKSRRQLIMELDKGQKIKTMISEKEQDTVEEILSDYTYFEKENANTTS